MYCMFEQCISSCLNIHNIERDFSISSQNTGSKSIEPKMCNTLALFYYSLLISIYVLLEFIKKINLEDSELGI